MRDNLHAHIWYYSTDFSSLLPSIILCNFYNNSKNSRVYVGCKSIEISFFFILRDTFHCNFLIDSRATRQTNPLARKSFYSTESIERVKSQRLHCLYHVSGNEFNKSQNFTSRHIWEIKFIQKLFSTPPHSKKKQNLNDWELLFYGKKEDLIMQIKSILICWINKWRVRFQNAINAIYKINVFNQIKN